MACTKFWKVLSSGCQLAQYNMHPHSIDSHTRQLGQQSVRAGIGRTIAQGIAKVAKVGTDESQALLRLVGFPIAIGILLVQLGELFQEFKALFPILL